MHKELRPLWNRLFTYNWKFGLFLISVVCIPRFLLVLHANSSGNYSYIGLMMVISVIVPFLFLTKFGRREIGIKRPEKINWLSIALFTGLMASLLLFLLGQTLYGSSSENWYTYIGRSYRIPAGMDTHGKAILFAVMAITGMTFSPIGEELFFRGIVHASFARSMGEKKASMVDSLAFALTHIAHFGLVFINQQWSLLPVPALIWVLSMFFLSRLFFFLKMKSDSLVGAMICHAAFNLGMIFSIFYLV